MMLIYEIERKKCSTLEPNTGHFRAFYSSCEIIISKQSIWTNQTSASTPHPHTHKNTTAKQLSRWFKPNKTITLLHHFLPTPPPYTQEKRQRTNIERQNPSFTVFLALHPFRETHHGHFPRCSIVTSQFSWFKSVSFSCFCGLLFLSFMFIYIYMHI